MIVKMNKYAWLVYHKEYDSFLERLRTLGVVHINGFRPTKEHPVIQKLKSEDRRVKLQLDYLDALLEADGKKMKSEGREKETSRPAVRQGGDSVSPADASAAAQLLSREEGEKLLEKIEALRDEQGKIHTALVSLEKDREIMSIWGDFAYDTIEKLRNAGYTVTFFSCQTSRYDTAWEDKYNAFVINTAQSVTYFITVTPSGTELLPDADRVKMPSKDYKRICREIDEENKRKEQVGAELSAIARRNRNALEALRTDIENESAWRYAWVQTKREAGEKVMLLEGWIPDDKTAGMEKALADEGYYCRKMEITDEDVIPIKLRNNKFTKLFEPITNLYSLPNYKEFDPTPLFAPFFMLFFGLCLGDGGYGLLLIIASILLKRKVKENMKPIVTLLLCFGIMTLVVGTVSGSFFGFSIVDAPYFSSVKDYFITSDHLMILSLVIGFFHVIYAKFIAAMKIKIQRGLRYSLSAFAWIFVILSLACIFVLPMVHVALPEPVEYVLYGVAILCGAVALFYNTPGKNIFLNFGSGLWATYNTVSGLVGDVLSYIRLYAIGLTGALLGGVFNSMAIDMTASMNPFVRWLPMLLILLVGHALNIGLSLISSLVHPLRLIYVEYYKNSEFEGGGLDYKPFRKL
ncbi:MAG: ATPase [Tannerella sp.]|jgi:V/A-type H+-transporting ATPase subunit I|nr:ATPase [Tannerella sp.]